MTGKKSQPHGIFKVKTCLIDRCESYTFLIFTHYAEKYRSIIEKAAKKTKCSIIALNDKQAVLVEGEKWRIVRKGKKVVFNFDKIP